VRVVVFTRIACRGFSDVYNCSLPVFRAWLDELEYVEINSTKTSASAWGTQFNWYLGDICAEIATADGKNQRITGNYADTNAMIYIDKAFSVAGCVSSKGVGINNNTFDRTYQLPANTTVDPGFANYSRLNFTLLPDSPIYAALPNFQPIPFDSIGLVVDEYRRELPTDEDTGRLQFALGRV
jgi:hypothetical protein